MDKNELYNLFYNSNSITESLGKLNMCDNSSNWKRVKLMMLDCGFDENIYKERKKRYCICCGNDLNKSQKKFCSKSCSAKTTNISRKMSEETKDKIKNKLSKEIYIKSCLNCGYEYQTKKIKQKFCCKKCSAIYTNNSKEKIDKLSKSRINYIINGVINGRGVKMEYIFKDKIIKCDSKIEYSCLNYFEKLGATDIKRCDFYIKYDDNGKIRRYNPDFKITLYKKTYIVECKSYMSIKNTNDKWRKYNEQSILKKDILKKYCQENKFEYFWFTNNLNRKFYNNIKMGK